MNSDDRKKAMAAIGKVFEHETAMEKAIQALPDTVSNRIDRRAMNDFLDQATHELSNMYAELEQEELAAQKAGRRKTA